LMEFFNAWRSGAQQLSMSDAKVVLELLAPLAPFMTEELWARLGRVGTSIHRQQWPEMDRAVLQAKPVLVVVQVNGKLRATLAVEPERWQEMADKQKEVKLQAEKEIKVTKWLENKQIMKVVWVEPKGNRQGLINFVVD